jgi:hypothetical protein
LDAVTPKPSNTFCTIWLGVKVFVTVICAEEANEIAKAQTNKENLEIIYSVLFSTLIDSACSH